MKILEKARKFVDDTDKSGQAAMLWYEKYISAGIFGGHYPGATPDPKQVTMDAWKTCRTEAANLIGELLHVIHKRDEAIRRRKW